MIVANTIREQIGGRALMMLGATALVGSPDGLQFRIKGTKICNSIRIVLDAATDTYIVEFWKIRGVKCERVDFVEYVYVDRLHAVIESKTGLYTSLGTMGRQS